MFYYVKQLYFSTAMMILGGSTLAVVSGLIAHSVTTENELTKILILISTLVGVVGGLVTAIGGTLVLLERIRIETNRISHIQLMDSSYLRDQVDELRKMVLQDADSLKEKN
jgi:hypothetical protein